MKREQRLRTSDLGSRIAARPQPWCGVGSIRASRSALGTRRAALLLEVVVALAIMVAAMGLLGAQLYGGIRMTAHADQQTRATELADRLLALLELDQEMAARIFNDRSSDGDFGDDYPGYLWRAYVDQTGTVGLGLLTIEILYQEDAERPQELDGARIIRELRMLKADPGRLNLAADFGVDEEQLEVLAGSVPIPGFNPAALDPQAIASLSPQELLAVLQQLAPILQQYLPPGTIDLAGLSGEDLAGLLSGGPNGLLERAGEAAQDGTIPFGGSEVATVEELQRRLGGGLGPAGVARPPGTGGKPPAGSGAGGASGGGGGGRTPAANSGNSGGRTPRASVGGGNAGGRSGAAGSGSTGNKTGAAPGRGGSGRSGGTGGARGGGSGGAQGGGAGQSGQPQYTIEDLMRLRDQSRGGGSNGE